jgi:DNA replicative helicase MCM subunit Mcm2 (Cdc46/Mcm family)
MFDLCIFGNTKKFIRRANKLEKVNLQTSHIVNIIERFMAAAIPRNITAVFRNGGVTFIMDVDRTVLCNINPETTRCVLGSQLQHDLMEVVAGEEAEEDLEEEDRNIEEHMAKIWRQFGIRGDDPDHDNKPA